MRKIFISHSWEESQHQEKILGILQRRRIPHQNKSISPKNAIIGSNSFIRSTIYQLIKSSDIVIFFIDHRYYRSAWIKYEHNIALKFEKQIIGVKTNQIGSVPAAFMLGDTKLITLTHSSFESEICGMTSAFY